MAEPDDAFWTLRPRRILVHEVGESGRIVVLRPKLLSARWKWLLRLLRKPDFRVKLDDRGGFVWLLCDGQRSVAEVAAATQQHFADPPEDSGGRTAVFLRELARGGFLAFDPPADRHGP